MRLRLPRLIDWQILFDPKEHTYKVEGALIPSVSSILYGDRSFKVTPAMQRGSVLHEIIAHTLRGAIRGPGAWSPLGEEDETRMINFAVRVIDGIRGSKMVSMWIEQPMLCWKGYAGTPDLVISMNKGRDHVLVDWKSGEANKPPYSYKLQMALYKRLVEDTLGGTVRYAMIAFVDKEVSAYMDQADLEKLWPSALRRWKAYCRQTGTPNSFGKAYSKARRERMA